MKCRVCRLVGFASVGLLLLLPAVASAGFQFVAEKIDSLPSTDRFYPSLALDSDGRPHVIYVVAGTGAVLKYASKTSDAWTIETVAPANVGHTALVLDRRDEPRILYHPPDGTVRFATRSTGIWVFETVGVGHYGSLALSPAGAPHVAYRGYDDAIRYARKTGGIWLTEIVDDENQGLTNCRIGLGPEGDVHIVYSDYEYSWDQDRLRYARRWSVGSWFREVATELQYLDEDLSLAIDATGSPHMTYANRLFEGPTYAWYMRRTAAGWTRELFDYAGRGYSYVGMGNSIALDAQGRPSVTYGFAGVFGPNEFRYTKRLTSGEWATPEMVETRDGGGYWSTAIALDRAGTVNVIYRNAGVLKFARRLRVAVPDPESLAKLESPTAAGQPLTVWVTPNPTTSEVEIRYRNGIASQALIDVVDVQGRRVFRAVSKADGADRITWKTTDDQGRRVASGVYYVSVRASGEKATTRLVVTR